MVAHLKRGNNDERLRSIDIEAEQATHSRAILAAQQSIRAEQQQQQSIRIQKQHSSVSEEENAALLCGK